MKKLQLLPSSNLFIIKFSEESFPMLPCISHERCGYCKLGFTDAHLAQVALLTDNLITRDFVLKAFVFEGKILKY